MAPRPEPSAPVTPQHAGRCPVCNTGVLYLIAVTDEGELIRCFNCDTQESIPSDGSWQNLRTADDSGTPTGFKLTPEQLAAKTEAQVDPYAPLDHPALAGSSSAAGEYNGEQVEAPAHETHDVQPQAGGL